MSYESQPQTPTSPGEYQHHFSTELGPDTSMLLLKERCTSSNGGQQVASSWELSVADEPPRTKEPLKPSSSLPDVPGFSRLDL